MKNEGLLYVLIALVAIVLILQAAAFLGSGPRAAAPAAKMSHLSITATGNAKGTPGQATLQISLEGKGGTAYAATSNLTTSLNQANSTLLRYVNNNVSLIQTNYYNLYNQSNYYYTSYNGYVAMESLTVTIPNVANVSAALGALSAINGTSVNGVSAQFAGSQLSSLRRTALSNALSNATAQAKALLPNQTLTVSNITVNYYSPIILPLVSGVVAGASNTKPNPSYFTGIQTVTESITVTFAYSSV